MISVMSSIGASEGVIVGSGRLRSHKLFLNFLKMGVCTQKKKFVAAKVIFPGSLKTNLGGEKDSV
jgi:hypothetical protein